MTLEYTQNHRSLRESQPGGCHAEGALPKITEYLSQSVSSLYIIAIRKYTIFLWKLEKRHRQITLDGLSFNETCQSINQSEITSNAPEDAARL